MEIQEELLLVEKEKFRMSMLGIEQKYNIRILLAYVRGSHMYGTSTEKSDVDVTFIYQQPTTDILKSFSEKSGLPSSYVPYIDISGTGDIVGFEIQNYLELLTKNNPTLLESLDIPPDCLIYKHEDMNIFFNEPSNWLTKLTEKTTLGYADSQIKKATGLKKNMNNPQPVKRKSILEFCYVIEGEKTVPFNQFFEEYRKFYNYLDEEFLDFNNWGLSKLQNDKQLYALYPNLKGETLRGIVKDEESTQLRVSQIPKVPNREVYTLVYNLDGFEVHCKSWASYKKWEKERNPERFKMNQEAGQNVDLKNMSHLFRLLEMALNLSLGKGLIVRSENVDFLREIKEGKHEYAKLMEEAEKLYNEIKGNFESVDLPEELSLERTQKILLYFRQNY